MSDEAYTPDDGEEAFAKSDAHTLGDIELEPWTPARSVAAQSMGMKYPHISAEDKERWEQTSIYPGAVQDLAIVLWLCAQKDASEVRRALRQPMVALDKAIEWAAGLGFTNTKSDEFWSGYDKFLDIVTEANASATVRKDAAGAARSSPGPN